MLVLKFPDISFNGNGNKTTNLDRCHFLNSPAHPDSVPGSDVEFQGGLLCAVLNFPAYKRGNNYLIFPKNLKSMEHSKAKNRRGV